MAAYKYLGLVSLPIVGNPAGEGGDNSVWGMYSDYDDIEIVTKEEGRAIGISGGIISKDGYAYSEPIHVMTGDIYRIKVGTLADDVCIIAKVNMSRLPIYPVYLTGKNGASPTYRNWLTCSITEDNGIVHYYQRSNTTASTHIYEVLDGGNVDIGTSLPTYYHYTTSMFEKLVKLNPQAEIPADGYVVYIPDADMDVVVSYNLDTYDSHIKRARVGVVSNIITKIDKLNREHDEDSERIESIESLIGGLHGSDLVIVNSDGTYSISANYTADENSGAVFSDNYPLAKRVLSLGTIGDMDGTNSFLSDYINDSVESVVADLTGSESSDISLGFGNCTALRKARIIGGSNEVGTMTSLFASDVNLEEIDLSGLRWSNITNLDSAFLDCNKLRSIDLSDCIDWSNITKFVSVFSGCSSLTDIQFDYDNVDLEYITSFKEAFKGCAALQGFNPEFYVDMSSATNASSMFEGCESLEDSAFVDSNGDARFDASVGALTDMSSMFKNTKALRTPVMDWIDTSNVTTMASCFEGCGAEELDLSSWDFSSVTIVGYNNMFSDCTSLVTLDISGIDLSIVTMDGAITNMFRNCTSLTNIAPFTNTDSLGISFKLRWCPLSADSVANVIDMISYTGSGSAPSLYLSRTAVDNYDDVNGEGSCAAAVAAKGYYLSISEDY